MRIAKRCSFEPMKGLDRWAQPDHLALMATLLDKNANKQRPRHPEKANRPDTEVLRKPSWIRVKAPTSKGYSATRKIVKDKGLVTVCEEAACPNIGECWEKSHATFMICLLYTSPSPRDS